MEGMEGTVSDDEMDKRSKVRDSPRPESVCHHDKGSSVLILSKSGINMTV